MFPPGFWPPGFLPLGFWAGDLVPDGTDPVRHPDPTKTLAWIL